MTEGCGMRATPRPLLQTRYMTRHTQIYWTSFLKTWIRPCIIHTGNEQTYYAKASNILHTYLRANRPYKHNHLRPTRHYKLSVPIKNRVTINIYMSTLSALITHQLGHHKMLYRRSAFFPHYALYRPRWLYKKCTMPHYG